MASVDLSDLIVDLKAEVNPPGSDLFPDAINDDDWTNQLRNAFWETVIDGLIKGYKETDGIVSPISGTTTLGREMQQVIIYYAGVKVIRNKLMNVNTSFKAKAGPVEYEVQQSAQLLKAILDELIRKRNFILERLSDMGAAESYVIDAVAARDTSMRYGDTWFVRS